MATMADVAGSVEGIVSVALKINEAVETVRQNKKECVDIAKLVDRNGALLKQLEEGTEITMDTAVHHALEDLAESLDEALKTVMECQQRHIIRRFFGAGDMAKELRRVKEDIVQKIMQASFATNIEMTIIMTHVIKHGGAPRSNLISQNRSDGFTEFSLSELKAATDDFSDENVIGRGVSAVIYKGVLRNGQVVAIKKFSDNFSVDGRMFCKEFTIGVKLQHKNVVNVLGYCMHGKRSLMQLQGEYVEVEEKQNFLVLRYVPNGSLHDITEGTRRIDLSSCFRIIEGIAECIYYLHEQCVVHMDLKPENILLDSDMNPVIIDFGISKMLHYGGDEISVQDITGSVGYIAPEHIEKGMVSTKCDVFAFGITLCQIISRVCTTSTTTFTVCGRREWDEMVQEAGGVKGLLDPTLQVDGYQEMEIERCMEVALLCTQRYPEDRPTMADVVQMLNMS